MDFFKKLLGYVFATGAPALTAYVTTKNAAAGLAVGTALGAIGARVLHLQTPPTRSPSWPSA